MPTLNFLDANDLNYRRSVVTEELLTAKIEDKKTVISASDLHDQSNRTLSLGDNRDKTRVHTFLKDGAIYVHVYVDMGGAIATVSHTAGAPVYADQVIPEIRSLATATDLEFAKLLLAKKSPLHFYHFNIPASFVDLNEEGYYGATESTIAE